MKIERQVTQKHIDEVADNMRALDIEECLMASGLHHKVALENGVKDSEYRFALTVDDKAVFIGGVCKGGVVWGLGTDDILSNKREFILRTKELLEDIETKYPLIHNFVYAKNKVHVSWLKFMGCDILDIYKLGDHEADFHYFRRVSKNV